MGNNRKPTARFQEGSGASLGAPELVRLSKRMSELGLASRREADAFIEKGWVLVDGKVAQLGQKVGPGARIELKAQASYSQKQQVTVLLNKPVGYVSGQAEDGYKPAKTLITPENRWAGDASLEQLAIEKSCSRRASGHRFRGTSRAYAGRTRCQGHHRRKQHDRKRVHRARCRCSVRSSTEVCGANVGASSSRFIS